MTVQVPTAIIPYNEGNWSRPADIEDAIWTMAAVLPPFQRAAADGPAKQQTAARIFHTGTMLYVRFDCTDSDIWGTYRERDDPIYDEEVVEVFLAPGTQTPVDYFELEVSPNGTLLDARIHNPTGKREDLQADFNWDCAGLQWSASRYDQEQRWQAILGIPLCPLSSATPPEQWRANFYRIERPRGESEEFSCWSPTRTEPADFHKPERFGWLHLA